MIKDHLKLAFQSLSHRKLRSWLTMIGIFIGIAAVVSLIGLGEGLRTAVRGQFGFLGNDVLSIQASGLNFAGPPGTGVVNPLDNKLIDKINRLNGVETSFNRYIEAGKLEFNDKLIITPVVSIPLGTDKKIFERMLNLEIAKGRFLRDSDSKGAIIGNSIAASKTFDRELETGNKILINGVEFEVIGIIEPKGSFILDGSIMINEDTILDIFGDNGGTDIIAVKVRDEKEISSVKLSIENLLRKEREVKKGEEDFTVQSPQSLLATLDSTLFAVQIFIYVIATISLAVGGIGIMNTMYTAVLERTKEIGIMKAIGAKNSTIFLLFSIESGFLGMVGGILGIILGLILAYGLSFIGRLVLGSNLIQASISPLLIFSALLFSFLLGTIFGVLPAVQASKLQPVEALRSK
ncbi:MAG: ABC transporter permease [Nanoarchaeota archaeon]